MQCAIFFFSSVCSMKLFVCHEHFAVCRAHCAVYSVQCAVCIALCIVCSVQCLEGPYIVRKCAASAIQCAALNNCVLKHAARYSNTLLQCTVVQFERELYFEYPVCPGGV